MKRVLCLILCGLYLFGEEIDLPLYDLNSQSPTLVAGAVNVVTGEFIDGAIDIKVFGPTVLSFERGYSSKDTALNSFSLGWRDNHSAKAKVFNQGKEVLFEGGLSSPLFFKEGKVEKNKKQTNLGGPTGGRAAYFNAEITSSESGYVVKKGSGASHELIREGKAILEDELEEKDLFQRLKLIKTPYEKYKILKSTFLNGGQFFYNYSDLGGLKSVVSLCPDGKKEFGSLSFHGAGNYYHVRSSDGQVVHFLFAKQKFKDKDSYLLKKVDPSNAPWTEYSYHDKKKLITEKRRPDGRSLQIEYDEKTSKVSSLKSPSGKEGVFETTYKFWYKKGEEGICYSHVLDANKNLTLYEMRHGKLSRIAHCGRGRKEPLYYEEFDFDASGQLTRQALMASQGSVKAERLFEYDRRGNIVKEKLIGNLKGNGGVLIKHFKYSEDNLLISETNGIDLKTVYSYVKNTDLLASKFLLHEGHIVMRTFFKYDSNGCLIQVVRDNGFHLSEENLNGVTEKITQVFTLRNQAPFGLPEIQEDFALNLKTKEQVRLLKKVFNYNQKGHLLREAVYNGEGEFKYETLFEYDSHGNCVLEVDPLGQKIFRRYDENDNLIEERSSLKSYIKQFSYDLMNRKVKEEILVNGKSYSTSFAYDAMGYLIETTDTLGRTTQFVNDHRGKPVKIIDAEGHTERFQYDIFGYACLKKDACDLQTITKRTFLGKPYHVIEPDGREERMTYDVLGRLKWKKTADGAEIKYTYDYLGRLVREEHFIDKKLYRFREWHYNAFHLLSERDFEGVTTRYTYDFAGRVVLKARDGEVTEISYDDLGRESLVIRGDSSLKKEYDFLNRVVREEWGTGVVKKYEYDADGNVTKTVTESDEGIKTTSTLFDFLKRPLVKVDEEGLKTYFHYEMGERVLRRVVTDPKGGKLISEENGLKQVCLLKRLSSFGELLSLQEKEFLPNGFLAKVNDFVVTKGEIVSLIETHYEYEGSHLVRMIEAANTKTPKITSYEYNELGQKSVTIKPDGILLKSEFDQLERVLSLVSSDEKVAYQYTYDRSDRIVEVKNGKFFTKRGFNQRGELAFEVFETGERVDFDYDFFGRLKKVVYPDGSFVDYAYGKRGLERVLRTKGEKSFEIEIKLNGEGRFKEVVFPENGGALKWQLDKKGRACLVDHNALSLLAKGFDERGNLIGQHDQTLGLTEEFSYDELDQLVGEYAYDSLGNRLRKGVENYRYNELNERSDLTYDKNGNLTFDGHSYYEYDPLNRLVAVNGSDHFRYDPFNRCIAHNEKTFFYGHSCMLGIRHEKEVVCRVVSTLKKEIGATLLVEKGDECLACLPDLFGNISALVDLKTGMSVERGYYKPFGEGGLERIPFGYQGKYTVGSLVFFGQRVYHKELGRFLTCDPSGFAEGPNLYAYTGNNPLKNCDHFGLSNALRVAQAVFFTLFNHVGLCYSTNGTTHQLTPFTGPVSLFGPPRELSEVSVERAPISSFRKQPHKLVTFVNGISTDEVTQGQNLLFLSELIGDEEFILVHHETNMGEGVLDDALRYVSYRLTGGLSNASKTLMETWENHLNRYPESGEILHICHSEGALHTKLALQALPDEMKSKINVVSIAGAAYIPQRECGNVWHYVSPRDVVPLLDPIGRRQAFIEGTLHTLSVHPDAHWFDHGFLSPTYNKTIQNRIESFIR